MSSWDRIWYGPVEAHRPYILARTLLLLLALDVWRLMIGRGAQFHLQGFNLAHYNWLQRIQPPPTAELYAGLIFTVGILAWVIALAAWSRIAVAILLALYTYAWSLSRLDVYQHHYLLSLVLFCLVFFPRFNARRLWRAAEDNPDSRPETCAWAYKLLGVSMGLVYFYTAVAKLDAQWLSGHTLKKIDTSVGMLAGMGRNLGFLGLNESSYWFMAASLTVVMELLIGIAYLAVVCQTKSVSKTLENILIAVWLLAMMLHVGFLIMDLHIGWFSYYMILMASVFLLPGRWLQQITWPVLRVRSRLDRVLGSDAEGSTRAWVVYVLGMGAAGLLVLSGAMLDLPGVYRISLLAAAVLVLLSAVTVFAGVSITPVLRIALATLVAAPVLWVTVVSSHERFEFYGHLATELNRIGKTEAALAAFGKAEGYARSGDPRLAGFQNHFGRALHLADRRPEAMEHYRLALQLDPDLAMAHSNLGMALNQGGQMDQALSHFETAVRLQPDLVVPRLGMAWILLNRPGRRAADIQAAGRLAQEAVRLTGRLDPTALDRLAAAQAAAGRFDLAATTTAEAVVAAQEQSPEMVSSLQEKLRFYTEKAAAP